LGRAVTGMVRGCGSGGRTGGNGLRLVKSYNREGEADPPPMAKDDNQKSRFCAQRMRMLETGV
jgi:hypothetical protein